MPRPRHVTSLTKARRAAVRLYYEAGKRHGQIWPDMARTVTSPPLRRRRLLAPSIYAIYAIITTVTLIGLAIPSAERERLFKNKLLHINLSIHSIPFDI